MAWWKRTKAEWKRVKAQYTWVALGTYLTTSALAVTVYFLGIKLGFDMTITPEGSSIGALLLGAWAFAKLSQIPRLVLTIAITPTVAKWFNKAPESLEEE